MDEDFKDILSPAEAGQGYSDGSSSTFAFDQRFLAHWCVCVLLLRKEETETGEGERWEFLGRIISGAPSATVF